MASCAGITEPTIRRWTRDEYYRIAEIGLFANQRTELFDGEVLVMSPHGVAHAKCVELVTRQLFATFGATARIRPQLPLAVGPNNELEPDVAVCTGSVRHEDDHPTTALLIVEVSDTSLDYDRGLKAGLYGFAGIADYWIINLVDLTLEVHRNPIRDAGAPFSFRYDDISVLSPDDHVSPLAAPDAAIAIKQLLP